MDAADLAAFTDALRKAAQRHAADFDKGLHEVGWREALVADPAATRAVFGVQGELNLASSALDDVLLHAIGRRPDPDTAVVVAPYRIGTRRLATAARIVHVTEAAVFEIRHDVPTFRAVRGIDPEGGWTELGGTFNVTGGTGEDVSHGEVLSAGRLALATELAAAAQATLDLARRHALDRVQFGKPIAAFQAIRHRLADSLVATASADAAVAAGWEEPTPYTAAMAKAIAGRSARTVARHAQQVLAGIGFTSEHPFHRYLRRVIVLDQLLGSAAELSEQMGAEAIRGRGVPAMLPL